MPVPAPEQAGAGLLRSTEGVTQPNGVTRGRPGSGVVEDAPARCNRRPKVLTDRSQGHIVITREVSTRRTVETQVRQLTSAAREKRSGDTLRISSGSRNIVSVQQIVSFIREPGSMPRLEHQGPLPHHADRPEKRRNLR